MSISWDDLIRDAGDAITSFEPMPDNDYDLQVVDSKVKPTKDGKKKMFEIKAKVVGGPHNGRFIWDNIVLTTDNPNALGFFFKKMAGLGLTADYFQTQRPSDERIVSDLKNRTFRAKIGSRVWNGEKKNEIKVYYPQAAGHGGGGSQLPPTPMAPPAPAPAPQAAPAPAPAPAYQPPAAAAPAPAPTQAPQEAPASPPVQAQFAAPEAAPAPAAPVDPWTGQPAQQAPAQPQYAPAETGPAAPPAPPAPPF